MRPTRRQVLQVATGVGAVAASGPLRALGALLPGRSSSEEIARLARRIRGSGRDEAMEAMARALRSGATLQTALGAVLRVGVEDIRPRAHGILHTVMMVHSTFALADSAPDDEAALAVLWNIDDLKGAQERDREEDGDWSLPPPPTVRALSPSAARTELRAALDEWDPERADRAVVTLLPHIDHDGLFEELWPAALRCTAFIGHKAILAAQLDRALLRLPRSELEPAARSLVRTLLAGRDTATWESTAGKLAPRPAAIPGRPDEPRRMRELYSLMRAATPEAAVDLARAALEDGAKPEELWGALRLVASELFHRRPGRRSLDGRGALLPVHGLTGVNALGHISRRTRDPRLAGRILLHAVAWLPSLRDWLLESTGLTPAEPALLELGRESSRVPIELSAAVATGSPETLAAHLRARPPVDDALVHRVGAQLRTSLLRTALEHHQHKFAVAVLEEAMRTPAELRPFVLAPAVEYLAHPRDEVTDLHRRSRRALED